VKVLFKKPLCIGGVDYSKGTHEVPDSLESHWFFKANLVNGSLSILEKGGQKVVVPEPVKAPEAPPKPAENYHEHMKQWESKEDKKAQTATQEEAQKMVDSGEAQIPPEAIIPKLDLKALQKQAKELGLKAGGKAAEIKERIEKHLAEKGEAQAAQ